MLQKKNYNTKCFKQEFKKLLKTLKNLIHIKLLQGYYIKLHLTCTEKIAVRYLVIYF